MDSASLLIETSSDYTFVALMTEQARVSQRVSVSRLSHNEDLQMFVAECFHELALTPNATKRIVLGRGPGSFTGLRIGFAFAKALAVTCHAEIVPIESFKIMAAAALLAGKQVFCLADARRGEYFSVGYYYQNGVIEQRVPLALRDGEQVQEIVASARIPGVQSVICSSMNLEKAFDGASVLPLEFDAKASFKCLGLENNEGFGRFNLTEIARLEPLYVREVAAKTIAQRRTEASSKNSP